ncbi:hypothetical protein [Suipraeoptans intestinalis]|uniref:hypothetical protein n=1 Tax=Suipraeoptans intestinalis TaxID=2606628 RepID=UPI001F4920DD|nr:hypothetical protein [Suipraeoptans intestinalis]
MWANHANGMLQISIWTALAELGSELPCHYNPVIDDMVRKDTSFPNLQAGTDAFGG